MDYKKLFINHHNVCISCKNTDTYTKKVEEIKNNKFVDSYFVRACNCGAEWIPRKPTEENIESFKRFVKKSKYIF